MATRHVAECQEARYRRPLYALSVGGGDPGVAEQVGPGDRGGRSEESLERTPVEVLGGRIGKRLLVEDEGAAALLEEAAELVVTQVALAGSDADIPRPPLVRCT